MKPRISIVTPYLDAAAFLQDAIDSVRAQTVSDWELLLIDDGSSDESVAIAASAAAADRRIRMLSPFSDARRGAAAARNRGLRAARGDFIAFLDADDLFEPDKLRIELALMDGHREAMMVCGAARWWYPEDQHRDWIDTIRSTPGLYRPPTLLNRIILLGQDEIPCICAVLIRREAIDTVGGFEEGLRLYEDQTLWAKIMSRYPVFMGRHLTSIYRQHEGSTSARAEQAGEYERLRIHSARGPFLAWVADYLDGSCGWGPGTERALRLAVAIASASRSGLSATDRAYLMTLLGRRLLQKVTSRILYPLRRSIKDQLPGDDAGTIGGTSTS